MDCFGMRQEPCLDLIDQLYDGKESKEIATTLFNGLQQFVPFKGAMFLPINQRTFEVQKGYCCGDIPTDQIRHVGNVSHCDSFLLLPECLMCFNDAVSLSGVSLRSCGSNSDSHYRSFKCHGLGVLTGWREQPLAAIRLFRDSNKHNFSEKEIRFVNRLAPHVAKAVYLWQSVTNQHPLQETGFLVFNAEGMPIFRNVVASDMLAGILPESLLASVRLGSRCFKNTTGLYRAEVISSVNADLLDSNERWHAQKSDEQTSVLASMTIDRPITIVAIEPFRKRQAIVERLKISGLSRREIDVTLGIMRGLSNAKVARHLFIDEKTVKDHLRHIYVKIQVHTRTELISKILGLDTELQILSPI